MTHPFGSAALLSSRRLSMIRPLRFAPRLYRSGTDATARGLRSLLGTGLLVLLALAATGAPELGVLSPAALKRLSVEELLQQEVISVSRRPEQWGQAASSIFALSSNSTQITGATRLPELLRLAPNLFVAQSTASHWAVNGRGFVRTNGYSNKLLVLIDGRTVYSPFFSNVFWDSQDVFLPDLERVEVITGPAGSNWGSNAVNGVINVLTKSAHDTQGTYLTGGLGTELQSLFGVRHGGRVGETGAYRVYAKTMEFDATLDAQGRDDDLDGWRFAQTGFRADWSQAGSSEFTVQGDAYRGRYDAGANPEGRTEGGNLTARWSRSLAPESHLFVRAYYDYSFRDNQGALTQSTHIGDLEFQHRLSLVEHQQFLWGANYRFMSDRMRDPQGFAILPEELDFTLGSVFAQHEWDFVPEALRLTSGLRLEYNHFAGWEYQPSLRLAWRPDGDHTFWAAASRTTRTPSRLETGFFFPQQPPYLIAGGPEFHSEELLAYELGWRGRPARGLAFTATVFLHEYDELRSVELVTPIVQANRAEGRSYGAELFVDWDVTPAWRLRVGGFRTEQETWNEPGSLDAERARGEISFPDFQWQVRNTFRIGPAVSLWLALRHVDDVPAFDNNTPGLVPAYTELDASVSWLARPGLELVLTGRNLLQPSHPEIGLDATRREIERGVQALVRWHF